MWLKERGGQRAFFPDPSNPLQAFLFSDDVGSLCYRFNVEGSPSSGNSGNRTLLFTQPSTSRNPLVAHSSRRSSGGPTINVKVVQAKMRWPQNGKPEFTSQNVAYINVAETTANITYITNAVQNKWGTDYVVVSSEGLPIEDSSGTQGGSYILCANFSVSRDV